MSLGDDPFEDMHRFVRDDQILDGLVDPTVFSDDADSGLGAVASLLEQARANGAPEELADEDRLVAAMAAVLPGATRVPEPRRTAVVHRLVRAKVAGVIVISAVGIGAAAAAVSTASGSRPHPEVVTAGAGASTTTAAVTMPDSVPATAGTEPTEATEANASRSDTTESTGPRSHAATAGVGQGPDAFGPAAFGLCVAWHDGRETGNKLNAPPFVNLAAAADAAAMTVDEYCNGVLRAKQAQSGFGDHGQGSSGDHGQSGQSHGQSGESHGQSGASHGQSGQSHGNAGGGS
jgi:hypothetical protein